jgi:hypothetical protein
MYLAKLRFDLTLASKTTTREQFKIVVGIRLLCLDDGTRYWGQIPPLDSRMPSGGQFLTAGDDITLLDGKGQAFASLTRTNSMSASGAMGAIFAATHVSRKSVVIEVRGTGKWTRLSYETQKSVTQETLKEMGSNLSKIAQATEWWVSSSSGFSLGAGNGRNSCEYTNGSLEFSNETRPKDPPIILNFEAIGFGYGTKGGGVTIAPSFAPCKGSYVVRGTIPSPEPFHPRHLVGACAIVDGSVGGVAKIPMPRVKGVKVSVPAGVVGTGTMFLFGTLGGLMFTSYKAGAVVVGLAGTTGTSGPGAAVNLCIGSMTLG